MQVLKINNNKGYYILDNNEYDIIDIDKEAIFSILNIIYDNDSIEMDEVNSDNCILNEASKVIYTGIYEYLNSFYQEKNNLKHEIDEEFSDLVELLNEKKEDEN